MTRPSDPQTAGFTRLWHGAYCRWYDAHYAEPRRRVRAAVWGWIADRLCDRA